MGRPDRNGDGSVHDEPHFAPPGADGRADPESAATEEPEPNELVGDEPALKWQWADGGAALSFQEYALRQRARAPFWAPWATALLAALAAGPAAGVLTFAQYIFFGGALPFLAALDPLSILHAAVIGPVIEEAAKVACLLWLVERKPWLLPGPAAIYAVGLAGGLGFGFLENLLYIHVYVPDMDPSLAAWRWNVTMPLHGAWSLLAAVGAARIWKNVIEQGRGPDLTLAFPWITAAIILHGLYNAGALILGQFFGS